MQILNVYFYNINFFTSKDDPAAVFNPDPDFRPQKMLVSSVSPFLLYLTTKCFEIRNSTLMPIFEFNKVSFHSNPPMESWLSLANQWGCGAAMSVLKGELVQFSAQGHCCMEKIVKNVFVCWFPYIFILDFLSCFLSCVCFQSPLLR